MREPLALKDLPTAGAPLPVWDEIVGPMTEVFANARQLATNFGEGGYWSTVS